MTAEGLAARTERAARTRCPPTPSSRGRGPVHGFSSAWSSSSDGHSRASSALVCVIRTPLSGSRPKSHSSLSLSNRSESSVAPRRSFSPSFGRDDSKSRNPLRSIRPTRRGLGPSPSGKTWIVEIVLAGPRGVGHPGHGGLDQDRAVPCKPCRIATTTTRDRACRPGRGSSPAGPGPGSRRWPLPPPPSGFPPSPRRRRPGLRRPARPPRAVDTPGRTSPRRAAASPWVLSISAIRGSSWRLHHRRRYPTVARTTQTTARKRS